MDYFQADAMARAMLQKGEIKAYCVGYTSETGKTIHLETDQGWDPYPMWQEFEPVEFSDGGAW